MTDANKPTVGSEHVEFYDSNVRSTLLFTDSKKFYCKSGYYAYIDETTPALAGCYATSTISSAPLSNCSGTPTTTNGNYVTCIKTSSSSWWGLHDCSSGYIS